MPTHAPGVPACGPPSVSPPDPAPTQAPDRKEEPSDEQASSGQSPQDLRPPPARGARAPRPRPARRGLRIRARRVGPGRARPIRSGSSTRAARASASRSATDRWPSTRAPARARSRSRAALGPRAPQAPTLDRRRVRAAFRAGRRTNRLGLVLGAIVVAFMLAFFSLAQQVRVSATGLDIGRLELERSRLEDTAPTCARISTGSAASRPSASKPSTQDSGSCPSRSSSSPTRRSRDRCWAAPIHGADSCSCCFVFVVGSRGPRRPSRLLADRRPPATGRRGDRPDDRHHRDAEQARRHLRPDRHGRPRHDRPARAARRGARPAHARDAPPDGRDADDDPRPDARRGDRAARQAADQVQVPHRAPRPRAPDVADRIRSAIADHTVYGMSLEPEPARVYPQAGGGPHSTLAAHLLGFVNREGGGQYGVEQQYQATAGRGAADRRRRARRERPRHPRRRDRQPAGHARAPT